MKRILGHIYFVYGILLFVVTMLIIAIPVWIVSFLQDPKKSRALHPIFKVWMGVFMPLVGCPVKRTGKEYFKKGENYVVVTNHNTFVDIPVSSPWIPGANKTLAKIEMSRIPIFGMIYKTGAVLVDRKDKESRAKSFADMKAVLDMGIHLCLYPEGTRNKTDKPLQKFKDGAFITAINAQKPIIAGVIFNTKKILPHNKTTWARPMPVRFDFLPPIETKGLTLDDVQDLKQKVFNLMQDHYIANQ